jgi:hypothetical protein
VEAGGEPTRRAKVREGWRREEPVGCVIIYTHPMGHCTLYKQPKLSNPQSHLKSAFSLNH